MQSMKTREAINLMNFTIYELKYMKICGILNFLHGGKINECADFFYSFSFFLNTNTFRNDIGHFKANAKSF